MVCTSIDGVVYEVSKELFKKLKSDEATKHLTQMSLNKLDFLNKRMM